MIENEFPAELSVEEIAKYEEIAAQLAKKYNTPKVHIYIGLEAETNRRVVGYLKEPSYVQKLYALDKIATVGLFMAGEELREILTLKDESDPKTFEDSQDCDEYKLGMVGKCVTMVQVIQNAFKKK